METKIILFDGVCNLCNGAINFIIKHDPKALFKFASLQGETGQRLLQKHQINSAETDSIVLIEGDTVSVKSSAALRIAKYLNKGYPLLFGFMIVPKFIRNAVYDYIARNRYKWFGKKESCMIPTPELKSRFLD
ncbi:thiol-disulfide oxidoreductase DCC family protein [Leeuwenhoekiella polynyae]|uniref:Putative DCC family thiol-disulfide oxidoreductase YuxK n=1 Tax=Leeuwenhoekiella polynyae TaxID=1550906 RepID=A0A4Q0PH09_9FLAO|nr:thiol-disulfide oxidoreductase DCC family protein [Leeuwenhoekiella polynyae]RXG26195.1 putative DCC family thiol-disulfide oxidoreductase YuxK [Leeuwenhoekiella polynyae]